jgi:CheY-like chemotaxis protein
MKSKPVVLIVEDHADTSQVIALLLGVAGVQVVAASNGLDDIEKCKSEKPDLIISDLMMPEMDGIEMIKASRADSGCSEVPIIVYTAYGEELAGRAIAAGASGVICKTQAPELLLNMIRGLLPDTHLS